MKNNVMWFEFSKQSKYMHSTCILIYHYLDTHAQQCVCKPSGCE